MVYKFPDRNGNMVETSYLNDFVKGIDEARRHGYSPGLNTIYRSPVAEKVTFAEAQKRLREQIGTGFLSDAGDRARAQFAAAVGQEVAKQLQAAGAVSREQAPIASGRTATPGQKRQGLSWAEAQKKLKADLGEDFLNEGVAPRAKSRTQAQTAVRRTGPNLAGCKLKQL